MPTKAQREAAFKKFEERFSKSYGDGSLIRADTISPYEVISTGSLALDWATGVGGLVCGRLHEFWGPDHIGKSTVAMWCIREAQRKHPELRCSWIDAEHKFDKPWAAQQGIDLSRLYLYPPDNAEDVADAQKDMIRSGAFSMIVLDSIGGMIPEAEKQKDADKAVMAEQAKIVTRMVKIAASECPKTNVVSLMLNQVRANLGYGADTMTGGGFALKHSTTMKFKFKGTSTDPLKAKIAGDDIIVGKEIAIQLERNGVAPAYKTAFITMFNQATEKYGPVGIDKASEAVTMGLKTGVIQQNGAWYTLPNGDRFNGQAKMVEGVRGDASLVEMLRVHVLTTLTDEVLREEIAPEDIPDPDDEGKPKFTKGASALGDE